MKKRLKELRKSLGLTQGAFGKKIGMSDVAISHMESGRTAISEQNLRLICLTFEIREDWLRTGDGEMKDEETEISEYEKRLLSIFRKLSPRAQDIILEHGENLVVYEQETKKTEPELSGEKAIHPIHEQKRA
jgi:transcriptional regulator with XRE-family HTH domain